MKHVTDWVATGDGDWNHEPFGDVDALFLAQLAYVRWEEITADPLGKTVAELLGGTDIWRILPQTLDVAKHEEALGLVLYSKRFSQVVLRRMYVKFEPGVQFAAFEFVLPDGSVMAAFRGTDNSLLGWRESFSLTKVGSIPSHSLAKEFLLGCAGDKPLRVCGHSKGGNLAVVASCLASVSGIDLLSVHDFDGPGFADPQVLSAGVALLEGRIHRFLPEASLVGIILGPVTPGRVVAATYLGFIQHSGFTWITSGGAFVELATRSVGSEIAGRVFHRWAQRVSPQERARLVDLFFDTFEDLGIEYLEQIGKIDSATAINLLRELRARGVPTVLTDLVFRVFSPPSGRLRLWPR